METPESKYKVGYKGAGMCEHCNQSFLSKSSTGIPGTFLYCQWYRNRRCKTVARNCVHGIKGLKIMDQALNRVNRKSQIEKNVIIHEIKNDHEFNP